MSGRDGVRRTVVAVGMTLTAAALAAGCAGTTSGGGTTASSGASGSSAGNLSGAPAVADPLNTTNAQHNPCGTITAAQLGTFNLGSTTKTTAVGGPGCTWSSGEPGRSSAGVTFLTSGAGLASVYGNRGDYKVFQELPPVAGYPAVYAQYVDQRPTGQCDVTVGVSDQLAMDIVLTVGSGQYKADPCTPDQQLAADVVTNIKNGG